MSTKRPLPKHLAITVQKGEIAIIQSTCPQCKKLTEFDAIPLVCLQDWLAGELIQKAFPFLNDTQREQLITGTCQTCWDAMWAEDDEDPAGYPVKDPEQEDFHADG